MGWAGAPIMRALNLRLNGRASSGPVSNSYNPRDSTEILKYFLHDKLASERKMIG
jgi:hypothetical protein